MENKVRAGGAGAAIAEIVIWLIESNTATDIPVAVEGAIVVLAALALGWLIPNGNLSTSTKQKAGNAMPASGSQEPARDPGASTTGDASKQTIKGKTPPRSAPQNRPTRRRPGG